MPDHWQCLIRVQVTALTASATFQHPFNQRKHIFWLRRPKTKGGRGPGSTSAQTCYQTTTAHTSIVKLFHRFSLAVAYHGSLLEVAMLAEANGCYWISFCCLCSYVQHCSWLKTCMHHFTDSASLIVTSIYNISFFILTLFKS